MDNKRQAVGTQPAAQESFGQLEGQLAAMVEHLVATCDHYAAQCTQESLLLADRQEQPEARAGGQEVDELAGMAMRLVQIGNQLAQALEQKERQCSRQKIQIDYLNARNLRYQRLYQRITGTWYGKILLKIYHLMQKLGWISK